MGTTKASTRCEQPKRAAKAASLTASRTIHQVRKQENGYLELRIKSRNSRIARRNQTRSSLLKLPPEIRISIHRYALGRNRFDIQNMTVDDNEGPIVSSSEKNVLALLLVCGQTYAESAPLPFRLSSFNFNLSLHFRVWRRSPKPIQRYTVETVAFRALLTNPWRSRLRHSDRVQTFQKLHSFPSLKKVSFDEWVLRNTMDKDQLIDSVRKVVRKKDLQVVVEKLLLRASSFFRDAVYESAQ